MIRALVTRLAKKYAVDSINELLEKNRDNVDKITTTVVKWINRLNDISAVLKNIALRASDGKIDDKETEDSISEVENLIRGF